VLKRHDPETLRFLLLSTHYRSPIEYSEERLVEVRRSLESFYLFFDRYQRIMGESFSSLQAPTKMKPFEDSPLPYTLFPDLMEDLKTHRNVFIGHMNEDFN